MIQVRGVVLLEFGAVSYRVQGLRCVRFLMTHRPVRLPRTRAGQRLPLQDVKARAFPKSGFELPDLFEDTLITLNIVLIYHHPKPYSRQYFLLFRSRAYPFKELLW